MLREGKCTGSTLIYRVETDHFLPAYVEAVENGDRTLSTRGTGNT